MIICFSICYILKNLLGSDDCTVRVWDQRHRASVVNMNAIYQVTAVCFGDSSDQVVSAGIGKSFCTLFVYYNLLNF